MKLKGVFPTPDSHCGLGEIFRHPIFTNADEQGRKEIMLKSALYAYHAYRNLEGEIIAGFTCRKLRQSHPDFGTVVVGESTYTPEIMDLGRK